MSDRVEAALAHHASIGHARSVPADIVPDDYPSEVEAALGIALPADYRRFLSLYPCTGGPDASVFSPVIGGEDGAGASLLEFQAYATGRSDLIASNDPRDDHHIPGMLIIGDDLFGNWFYLDLASGEVWFSDRDAAMPGQREGLQLLGADFSDFLLRMEIEPETDEWSPPPRKTLWDRLLDWIAP